MEKQKRWHFCLIVAVLVLTLYNILPTLFYYSKPLTSPIDAGKAKEVAEEIVHRVNQMEEDSREWLASFSQLLGLHPISITSIPEDPSLVQVRFGSAHEANLFGQFLPKAGGLIPFLPAQLELRSVATGLGGDYTVLVQRNLAFHLDPDKTEAFFRFTYGRDEHGQVEPFYAELVRDRAGHLASFVAGNSWTALDLEALQYLHQNGQKDEELVLRVAEEIQQLRPVLQQYPEFASRYYSYFAQGFEGKKTELLTQFLEQVGETEKGLRAQLQIFATKQRGQEVLDPADEQKVAFLDRQLESLQAAQLFLKTEKKALEKGPSALKLSEVGQYWKKKGTDETVYWIDLTGFNPFVQGVEVQWTTHQIGLVLYPDLAFLLQDSSESHGLIRQFLLNEVARVARLAGESLRPVDGGFYADLHPLQNASSYLALDLTHLAEVRQEQVANQLKGTWSPTSIDLLSGVYPIHLFSAFQKLPLQERQLGLVVYSPLVDGNPFGSYFRNESIYVFAKGMAAIVEKYQQNPDAEESRQFLTDFRALQQNLAQSGFIGYPGVSFGLPKAFAGDYIFELSQFAQILLKATRENFKVFGGGRYAVLDFSDVEQRILTWNRIQDAIQEDLLKWKEAYHAAQVDLNVTQRYTVPAPTKSAFWQNFLLSAKKYFRGDDRKILKWGLDLSGGKSVKIGLVDSNGEAVTDTEDLHQAVNELYARINKMGVSERTIRIENSTIAMDFPGSQNLSAAELVKASAMYFHVVNEKFGPFNPALAASVQQFLQEVWNEAVVTNRQDIDSIQQIAWRHLSGGQDGLEEGMRPMSESARQLYAAGLRLADPYHRQVGNAFDDTLSKVAIFKGAEGSDWAEQTHPLLFVFNNYALEGANLENIQASYDASQGNILSFGVKSQTEIPQESLSPRDALYAWTSQFSEEKIAGTVKETYSKGRGWRMAVILNGSVITSPTLNAALREGGTISGRFSQREVALLAADLKAGSMSFTPKILSEQNVSPELGQEERDRGMWASLISLVLVVVAMVGYYRFAGVVASCAVLLNILIMWGVLQNIGAALTLPGIAGIVLTIGMAVDANVLVFERVREEFKVSKRIGPALQAGYRKAFSAIVDSNVTTILAALILIQFDSGPIKGFAVTLIIGIVSSMFTALFMTRYFFAGWVRRPENKELHMMQFLQETRFHFLKKARLAFTVSLVLLCVGSYFFMQERKTLFGMDFTGGYSLQVTLAPTKPAVDYRKDVLHAFWERGASKRDVEVRQLNQPNQLRIQFGTSMDERNHPFYQMPDLVEGQFLYAYQKDPRLNWVVQTLEKAGLKVVPEELDSLDQHWSVMSGQFSDAMRNQALLALGLALFSILIYITVRFEFKYAIGAVAGLVHDVLMTIGLLAFLHAMGWPVQVDLQVVGAIMTIIGYSLNDTIIVFDRIREEVKILRRMSFEEIINHSLNVTLSRTLMTSGTTLLVLLALVLFGGDSIFSFSLVMTIGVVVGTFSSLFIASPVMLYFHKKEVDALARGSQHGVEA